MKRMMTALGLVAGLGACSAGHVGAPFEDLPPERIVLPILQRGGDTDSVARARADLGLAPVTTGLSLLTYEITVPGHLSVYDRPGADIVWLGDPHGKRKAQVARLLQEALERTRAQMQGDRGVVVQVELDEFRTRTGRLRPEAGGVHRIRYYLTAREAGGGAEIIPRKLVRADLPLSQEPAGPTEKERILRHLNGSILGELQRAAETLPAPQADRGDVAAATPPAEVLVETVPVETAALDSAAVRPSVPKPRAAPAQEQTRPARVEPPRDTLQTATDAPGDLVGRALADDLAQLSGSAFSTDGAPGLY